MVCFFIYGETKKPTMFYKSKEKKTALSYGNQWKTQDIHVGDVKGKPVLSNV